ncbi:MAG: hypothetical protein U0670_08455 [Anaerolineae bacterium]
MGKISGVLWAAAVIGASIFAYNAQPVWGDHPLLVPALIAMWLITLATLAPIEGAAALRKAIAAPVHALRRTPIAYWLVILVYMTGTIGVWLVQFQPTNGRALQPFEFAYLLMTFWGWLYLIQYDGSREEAIASGRKLAKNPLTGVMITLTTVLLLFGMAEAYLRVFYITTDAYTFTAMNYWWYQNFYYPSFNSLGFRDHEPMPDAPHRIAVVGDSFVVGQGINNLDDTFSQLIERGLNDGTDVNVVAQTGWDTDVEEYNLNLYPYRPDTVILSYYLNDIDYLLTAPDQSPDRNFQFPEQGFTSWFVLNFFVPNYVYYNLLQFTSSQRNSGFIDDLVSAHLNPDIWDRQAQQLDSFVAWTERNHARLIALVWPNPAGIDLSQPAVDVVVNYFTEKGIDVVNMSEPLRGHPVTSLIVNNFDTHPGVLSHRLAADALLAVLRGE